MQASYLKFNFLTNDDHKTLMFSLKTNKIFTIFARITSITINDIYEHKKKCFQFGEWKSIKFTFTKTTTKLGYISQESKKDDNRFFKMAAQVSM